MSEIFDPTRPSVLIVDDVEANLVALEALLDSLHCNLVRARSGNEGLKQLLRREFAVILLDVQMPGMDGYEMARLARSHPSARETPIIFITANNLSEDTLLQGYGSGAVDVLFKPVSPIILRGKVQVFLDLSNAHRRLEDEIHTHKSTLAQLQASRDELVKRHEALERAQEDQRELTEFIVHDLKNPLTVVNAGLELVGELVPDPGSDLGQTVSEAAEAARRLRTMVEDLLTISRMEQSDFPLQREAVSVTKLLRAVIQAYVRRAQERGIALAPPPELSLEIKADRTLLQRVLENILDNAFRYTPAQGRIAVTTARSTKGVEINVSNDGPAIPERERERVFEKFRRGARDASSSGNAGLGLYFCKRAVEAHGGGIDIVQIPDWPTSFRISLPS
jgi:signal transduction histidine kinase